MNTPDQANITVKAMTSKSVRLMVSVTKSQAPAKMTTKLIDVVSTRRLGMRCSRTGLLSRRAAKPRTIMPATLSCRSLLLFSGMHPTRARFTPIVVRHSCTTVAAPRRAAVRPRRTRSRRTRMAKTTTSMPPTLSEPLKKPAETSWNVPSWLKCSCHQSGSVVVRIDARMPPTSATSTSPARCIVEMAAIRRDRRVAAEVPKKGTVEETAMLM